MALLLAVLAGATVLAAWLGHRIGNDARDVRLMLGIGGALAGCSAIAW